MGEKVEKQIGMDPYTFRGIVGLAANAKGELFVLESEGGYGASACRVFDRDGKYLRTIMPYSAATPPERTESVGQLTTKTGQRVPIVYNAHGQNLSPYTSGMKNQTMAFDPDGALVLFSSVGTMAEHGPPRFLLFMNPQGGAAKQGFVGPPLTVARGMLGGAGERDVRFFDHLAVSKDGQSIYLSGGRLDKPRHAIYRVKPTDTEMPKPWLGEVDKSGDDDGPFQRGRKASPWTLPVASMSLTAGTIASWCSRRTANDWGKFDVTNPVHVFVHPGQRGRST